MLERSTLSAIVSVGCLLAVQAQAQAQPTTKPFVDLQYDIDPSLRGCPTLLEFRAFMARELGYDPYLAGSPMGLAVRVRTSESGIEAIVHWSVDTAKKAGERRFAARAEECHAMLKTVGFVASVQIQLMADEHRTEQQPKPSEDVAVPNGGATANSGIAPVARSGPATVTLSKERFEIPLAPVSNHAQWSFLLGAGPAVGVGLGPSAVGIGRFFGAVQHRSIAIELGVEGSLPSTTRQTDGGGFRQQSMLGTLAGCAWYGPISACAVAKLGLVGVQGVGVDVTRSPKGLLAQVGPRGAYAIELYNHFALLAHLDLLGSLTSWTVDVNHSAVWTMPRVAGVAGIDLMARFR